MWNWQERKGKKEKKNNHNYILFETIHLPFQENNDVLFSSQAEMKEDSKKMHPMQNTKNK